MLTVISFSIGTIVLGILVATVITQISLAQSPVASNNGKIVILTFDDGWQSQIEHGKPILDKYGFKGTFFIVCNYIGKDASRMTWDEVSLLMKEGHDIQAHTMNHKNLNKLSSRDLDYELGESQRCLAERGFNSTIFATPFNEGWNNATVIKKIAKYYELARNGNADIMFLRCDKWNPDQTDCRTFSNNGTLTFANKYSIRAWSHNFYDNKLQHNKTQILDEFVKTLRNQERFNTLNNTAIPIIIYHKIDNTKDRYSTSVDLFEKEMEYLRDNGYKVLTMDNLGYDSNTNHLYLEHN